MTMVVFGCILSIAGPLLRIYNLYTTAPAEDDENYDDNGEKQDEYLELYPQDNNMYFDPNNDIRLGIKNTVTGDAANKYRRINR